MFELEPKDIEILNYSNQYPEITIDQLLNKFPESEFSTTFRVQRLSSPEFDDSSSFRMAIPNSNYLQQIFHDKENKYHHTEIVPSGIYYITNLGKSFLQTYNQKSASSKKEKRKDFLLRVIPIFISIIALIFSGVALYFSYLSLFT